MNKISTKKKIMKLILIVWGLFFGLFFCIGLLELGIRITGGIFEYRQQRKNITSIKHGDTYRILCLGYCTTALGGKYSYPNQLEEILNESKIGKKFAVINEGLPGIEFSIILRKLESNLNKYNPEIVVLLVSEDFSVYRKMVFSKNINCSQRGRLHEVPPPDITPKDTLGNMSEIEIKVQKLIMWLNRFKDRFKVLKLVKMIQPSFAERQAEESFKKAIELNPADSLAYANLAWFYGNQGKYAQAEESFKKAIELNPTDSWAYANLAWLYGDQDKYAQAEESFKKAIELSNIKVDLYGELAWLYRDQGKYAQAEESFKKAIELSPENYMTYRGLAVLYEERGEYAMAEEYYKKADQAGYESSILVNRQDYLKFKDILDKRGIKLICVQSPMRSVEVLKKLFEGQKGVIFVDNEKIFKAAVKATSYSEYFIDAAGGDFGHCTPKGNRLLAENIANTIIKEVFKH